jgi:hypothetical protein
MERYIGMDVTTRPRMGDVPGRRRRVIIYHSCGLLGSVIVPGDSMARRAASRM